MKTLSKNRLNIAPSRRITRIAGGMAAAGAVLLAPACSSNNMPEAAPSTAASPQPSPETTPSPVYSAAFEATMRRIAVQNALSVLNDLDRPGNGTVREFSRGEAYISNKAALIDESTGTTKKDYTAPEMRAVYLPANGLLEVLSTNSCAYLDNPDIPARNDQFVSVASYFRVLPGAAIANASEQQGITTQQLREALDDETNVKVVGIEAQFSCGSDKPFDVATVSLANKTFYLDSMPNGFGLDFRGEPATDSQVLTDYLDRANAQSITALNYLAKTSIQ